MITEKIGSGKTPTGGNETYIQSGVLFLRSQNIHFDGLRLDDVVFVDNETDREMRSTRVRADDSLLNITGASIGRVARATTGIGRANVNQHVCIVRPSESVDPRYLTWCLAGYGVQQQIRALQAGGNRDGLNFEQVGNLGIPHPPIDEQRRIADFLDAETAFVDRIQRMRSQQKEQLIQRRWSVFQHALHCVPTDALPLRRLLHAVVDGPFGSAFSSSDYVIDGAAVVRLGNIGFCEYLPADQARIPISLYREFRKHEVREGDILIAGLGDPRNHAGRACIAPDLGPAIVKGKCFRARVDPTRTSAAFIALLLSSPLGSTALGGRGSTRSMINLEVVKSAVLPVPRYADQLIIADRMSRYWRIARAAIETCERQVSLVAERRQALITAAVTGQIDVTTARGVST
jgi:type I restriction enzyme S subunit